MKQLSEIPFKDLMNSLEYLYDLYMNDIEISGESRDKNRIQTIIEEIDRRLGV